MAYPFETRLASYSDSLASLREAPQRDPEDSFVLSGTASKFSITFELAWKTMRDVLTGYYGTTGFVTGLPRETLRTSFRLQLISDDRWMDMLDLRNQLAHDYDLSTVRAAFETITTSYLDLFDELERKLVELAEAGDSASGV